MPPGGSEAKKADERSASLGDLISQSAAISQLNKVVERRDFGANIARDLARADLKLKVSEYLFIWVGAIVGIPVFMFLAGFALPALQNPIILLVGAVIGFILPRWYVQRRQGKRINQFNKQLPDTITLIANALRAGSSFLQAIELVVREARPPISTEFARVIREVNLGLPFEQALENLVRRVRSDDLELMVTAISIQYTGGRQPRRDPGLDRLHDPRAGPHQGRDPHPDRPAADVRLRRGVPADRPGRVPVHHRARPSCSRCSTRR